MLSIYLILVGPYFVWPAHLSLVHVMPDVVHIPHSCLPLLPLTCTPLTCSCHAWCCPYTSFLLAPTSSDLHTSHLFMSCLMLSIYLILVGPYFLSPAHLSLGHVMPDVVHKPHSCWPLLPLTCTPLTCSCHAWYCPYTSFLLAPTSSDVYTSHLFMSCLMLSIYLILVGPYFLWRVHLSLVHVMRDVVHIPHSCWPLLPLTCTPLTCSCHAWCCPYTSFLLAPTSSDLHTSHLFMSCLMLSIDLILVGPYFLWPVHLSLVHVMPDVVHIPHSCWPLLPLTCTPLTCVVNVMPDVVHRPHSCWPLLPLTWTPLTCSCHAWCCPYTSFLLAPTSSDVYTSHLFMPCLMLSIYLILVASYPTSSDLHTSHLCMSCLMLSIYLILVGPYFLWPVHLSLVHVMPDVVHIPHSCWPLLPLTCTLLTCSCHAWCCP